MQPSGRAPAGPRGVVGAAAESAAVAYLQQAGWTVLARNVRVNADEIDILASEPGSVGVLVLVEVRSTSTSRFGSAAESVDARKVGRLYRAAGVLRRQGLALLGMPGGAPTLTRVDLVTLRRVRGGRWSVEDHLRGLAPP